MTHDTSHSQTALRILCIEDNPLIVLHLQQMIEDLGHVYVGALDSLMDLKDRFEALPSDCALVDIDLADGRTGPEAATWLLERGIPSLFVTGQESIAKDHKHVVVDVISKPVSIIALQSGLDRIAAGHLAAD
jgi:CheY-like chemotaxis protein